jgi:superfamily II DNA or RNA helicase
MGYLAGTLAEHRDYQERICATVTAMIDGTWVARDGRTPNKAKSILIEAPVGSGKTVMALALGQHAVRERGLRVGVVAMRRNLLLQAQEMHDRLGFKIPNFRQISMFDSDPPTDVDFLIVDEAQHDSTHSMARIHGIIKPKFVIGLTATPFRSDGAQLAFERTVRDVGIHYLISEGYLSKFDHYTIPKYSPYTVAELFSTFPGKWGKSLIFFLTMEECLQAKAALAELGFSSEVVWGGSDREQQLADFEAGKFQILISMSILTEGFDAPDLQTVFVRPSSKLPAIQMGGRVLRKCAEIGVKQIVQCQASYYPFTRTATPRQAFIQVGDQFRSLTRNDKIDQIVWDTASRVLRATSTVPEFLSKQKKPSHWGEYHGGSRRRRRRRS